MGDPVLAGNSADALMASSRCDSNGGDATPSDPAAAGRTELSPLPDGAGTRLGLGLGHSGSNERKDASTSAPLQYPLYVLSASPL
eukprot:SAG25_NODE_3797_length_968_cov_0.850403_2_plen_84_part_01